MRLHSSLLSAGAAALLIAGLPGVAAADPPGAPGTGASAAGSKLVEVDLVTGDTVMITPDGQVGFRPGEGRSGTRYLTYFKGEGADRDRYLVPADALEPLRAGVLDERLFDITDLVADGYAGQPLPLIVRDAPGKFAAAAADEGLWDKVKRSRVERVWLDGKSRVTLAESVPQIGAPAAWQSGYTGKGVTVAVLDSGYDPTHPDLAGHVTAAKDFTGTSPEAIDGHGHGTHVASTVAGSGAASGGKYKGVAPDAKLLIAKVCSNAGECADSDIIAGLQWAAENGASVVNLSLGGNPTDGTDPLSTAVNEITERTGMLVVVASGNFGCRECVGNPGSADKALTVGSVTKQDTLSDFSSQGPRVGDGALKPDLAAPGTAITAARAKGTAMGTPVGDGYTTADGTSMASPHVAGAAALLKQVHPDWTAARLKAALMSSAKGLTDLDVFQQGAGRVDVATAVSATITPDTGSLSYGKFSAPYTENPGAKNVTYTNDTGKDVTLNLAVTGDAMFAVDRATVTVPAHGSASVALSATVIGGTIGVHGAVLTATADGVSVRTPMGAVLEPETHELKIEIKSRNGGPITGSGPMGAFGMVYGIDGPRFAEWVSFDSEGRGSIRVPPGRYQVAASVAEGGDKPAVTTFADDLSVTADTTMPVDLTKGELVDVAVDAKDAQLYQTMDAVNGVGADGQVRYAFNIFAYNGTPTYLVPNAEPGLGFTFIHATTLGSPKGAANPYAYSLFHTLTGNTVPGRTTFTKHDNELAREDAVYDSQGVVTTGKRVDWNLDNGFFSIDEPGVAAPGRRTEYFTPGTWIGTYQLGTTTVGGYEYAQRDPVRKAGTTTAVVWGRAPLGVGQVSNFRDGGYVAFIPAMYDDANPEVWLADGKSSTSTGSAKLTIDGKEVPLDGFGACVRQAQLPEGTAGAFEFTCDSHRVNEFSKIGTASSATWKFHSAPTTAMTEMPMLGVRLSSPTVVNGFAPARQVQKLDLDVFRTGATGAIGTRQLTFEVSYDDGKTWKPVPVGRFGDHAFTLLAHPKGAQFVSTRITAADGDGNSVTQTTIRSYGLS
ncbi:serine protease [Actinorhabdospora filicis]|uniref:Serine protease n=1 Tax=Actinorhabdospora filicis TaxID=1785913 RepID=A0A9W6SIV7_9ACTN|nr:S8 family serine peptidase [Actinorhabdospora filicis]GLZ77890.1 serine protease [Actinorhabdospora filicis]